MNESFRFLWAHRFSQMVIHHYHCYENNVVAPVLPSSGKLKQETSWLWSYHSWRQTLTLESMSSTTYSLKILNPRWIIHTRFAIENPGCKKAPSPYLSNPASWTLFLMNRQIVCESLGTTFFTTTWATSGMLAPGSTSLYFEMALLTFCAQCGVKAPGTLWWSSICETKISK